MSSAARPLVFSFLLIAAVAASCGRPSVQLPGVDVLAGQAIIRRDTFGIPHILAKTEEAAAFAFGYAQAEDHASEIGRRYLAARGEAARYFGDTGLTNDLAIAQFDNLAVSRQALQRIDPLYRRIIAAYAAGVNQYVTGHRGELPEWMPDITAADVLASTRASAATALAGAATVRRLREKYEGTSPAGVEVPWWVDDAPGSNALALAGSRTTTGKPILLGNPHLQWSSLYWEAHVRVPGRIDFYGSTLVGIPVLRAGFNDRLAFVTTNNAPDLDDILTLTLDPGRPDHYRFDGDSRPLQRREVTVPVRNPDGTLRSESRTFWSSHLGPVIYRNATRVFAVRSTRLDAFEYFFGFYELSKARSLEQWTAALRRNHVPTSNFTYADADGNVMYWWNARLPVRDAARASQPDIETKSSADLWTRFHDVTDFPRMLNPARGYVQNANNPPRYVSMRDPIDMTRYPEYIERGQLALRPQLALRMLEEKDRFSVQDVIDLKYSTRMLLAERVKGDLIAAVRGTTDAPEDARTGADVLERWDDRVSADSRGAVVFQRFWDLYSAAVRPPYERPWSETDPVNTPSGLADRAAAVTHLAAAVRDVRQQYGSERVAWGEVHRFRAGTLDLPGDGATGTYGTYRVITFADPSGGGNSASSVVRVAGYVPGRDAPVGFGDAWVLLVDFSRPGSAWSVLAYGQTTKPDSPHSSDQMQAFAEHRLRRALYSEEEIKGSTRREYQPR